MGGEQFVTRKSGKTAAEAFKTAVEWARHEYGHRGYTGSIAEKSDFKMCSVNDGETPEAAVNRYLDDDNHFSDDKWGPAACIDAGPVKSAMEGPRGNVPSIKDPPHLFIFFGWASS